MDNQASFLIVQLGRIGDLILMTPMFNAIKTNYPASKITVLCGRNNHHFLQEYPLVDEVLVHWKKPFQFYKLIQTIKQTQFDYWIDPKDHYSRESHFFARRAKAKCKIGFNTGKKQSFNISLKSHDDQFHNLVVDRNLAALESLNLEHPNHRPVLFENPESIKKLNQFLTDNKLIDYIHINISASLKERFWPTEKWIDLIQKISRSSESVLISSDPADMVIAKQIANSNVDAFYYKTESFNDVITLVKNAKIVISPDTSIIHIAGAFNRPVIGLYANRPWNLKKFYPLSDLHRVLINQDSDTFIAGIEVIDVLNAFTELSKEIKV